jgi:hypothetical protein
MTRYLLTWNAAWVPRPVWINAENLAPTRIRSPDHLACSKSLYRTKHVTSCRRLFPRTANITFRRADGKEAFIGMEQLVRWAGHVARMEEVRGVYRVLVGKPEGKRPLG